MHKNKDVEQEALTINDERSCSIQVDTCQKNGQNHQRFFCGQDKRTVLIVFFSLISIVCFLMLILLSFLLQNSNEANNFISNGVESQKGDEKFNKIYLEVTTEQFKNKTGLDHDTKLNLHIPIGK